MSKFRIEDADKDIIIIGPWNLHVAIDFDDVDHDEVRMEVKQLVKLLNKHWDD